MSEIGSFFVKIGSQFDKKGFDNARDAINKVALAGIAMGGALAVAGMKAANAAGIQEQAEFTLGEAMKQAGTYTDEAHKHNLAYAKSLQTMTTYGDEAILGVQKMLTNFGVEGKALDGLTKATLDLAAAKGMDLKAAADLVAKSVGSTTNALTRYGIVVEGDANSTERMQMAVDNITKIFGGSAQAMANTYAGRMTQLKNTVGDLWEKVGFALIPVIEGLVGLIKTNVLPALDNFLSDTNKVSRATEGLGNFFKWIIKIGMGLKAFIDLLTDTFANLGGVIVGVMTANMGLIKESVKGFKKMGDKVTEYGKKFEELEKLKVEKTAETEAAITETITTETEARREVANADAEAEMLMAEAVNEFYKFQEDEKLKEEEARAIARKKMADDVAMTMVRGLRLVADVEVLTWRSGVKAFGEALKERLNYFIYSKTQELIAAKVVALAKAIFNSTTTFGAASYQIGMIVGQFGAALGALKAIQSFDTGGIVPGMLGQPRLAIVHGGETIIPPDMSSTMNDNARYIININQVHSRHEAERQGEIVGDAILRRIKRSRKIS